MPKNITTKKVRPEVLEFDKRLKEMAKEQGMSAYIFIGRYENSEHPGRDEAVSSIVGPLPDILQLGDAVKDVIAEAALARFAKDLKRAAGCDTCPDRDRCLPAEEREKCNA